VQWNPQKRRPPERTTTIPELRVEVKGSEIVVIASAVDRDDRTSDSDYRVTYHKPANAPQLIAKNYPRKEDKRVAMTLAEFLTAAWRLANDKAQELGWIA
jgi:hypothetical protein